MRLRLYLCLYVCTNACAHLMPAQCVSGQPQMTVRAGVCLIGWFQVSLAPAGPLTAPQRATCGVGGPCNAKVRSRVCLVAHFLATRGKWWQRIRVFLQHSNKGVLCYHKGKIHPKIEQCRIYFHFWVLILNLEQRIDRLMMTSSEVKSWGCSTDNEWMNNDDFTEICSMWAVSNSCPTFRHKYIGGNTILSRQDIFI